MVAANNVELVASIASAELVVASVAFEEDTAIDLERSHITGAFVVGCSSSEPLRD